MTATFILGVGFVDVTDEIGVYESLFRDALKAQSGLECPILGAKRTSEDGVFDVCL
ncbi:MAG: hypothetical protein O7A65_07920 [Proteobacteria bacterium]|nr:hypothetical protein [Pseudomonadota bacterium]